MRRPPRRDQDGKAPGACSERPSRPRAVAADPRDAPASSAGDTQSGPRRELIPNRVDAHRFVARVASRAQPLDPSARTSSPRTAGWRERSSSEISRDGSRASCGASPSIFRNKGLSPSIGSQTVHSPVVIVTEGDFQLGPIRNSAAGHSFHGGSSSRPHPQTRIAIVIRPPDLRFAQRATNVPSARSRFRAPSARGSGENPGRARSLRRVYKGSG